MNPGQMAEQIKAELQAITWPSTPLRNTAGSSTVVFGGQKDAVVIFAGTPTQEQIPPGFPWCLVGPGSGSSDPDHPEFITQTFDLVAGVAVGGDPFGQFALIGSSVADQGKSVGRGILEVDERVRAAVQNLTGADGAKVILSASDYDTPTPLGPGRHLVVSTLSLTALCTSTLQFAAPQQIAEAADTWTWEGSHCSDRFDFLQYRLVHQTGAHPANPADGTTVYTGTDPTTSHTPLVGEKYTVFADYSGRGVSGVVEGSSEPEVGSLLK